MRAEMVGRTGRHDFAVMALERAVELWPSNPAAWRNLALSARSIGRADLATEAERRFASLAPGGADQR